MSATAIHIEPLIRSGGLREQPGSPPSHRDVTSEDEKQYRVNCNRACNSAGSISPSDPAAILTARMPEIDSPETAKRIFRASRTWIFDRTVAIYAQARGGNPRLEGSGVLLQIADAPFMLSAGHVLRRRRTRRSCRPR